MNAHNWILSFNVKMKLNSIKNEISVAESRLKLETML